MSLFYSKKQLFSKIYDKYIDKIYRFILLKVKTQETAEDLTSEVFVRMWSSFNQGKEIKNPQAFLYQIARNLVIDYYRQKPRMSISLANYKETIDPKLDLESKTQNDSDIEDIKTALSGLNDNYKEVITLCYIEDISVPEVAQILDKKEGTVRVMLHRALKALRGEIKKLQG